MKKLIKSIAMLLGLGTGVSFTFGAVDTDRPNVIIFFVDDQGYYDLSSYGATEVETTNIDRLAKEGIRFTDYYAAAPICSPSRAGLLTGSYPRRLGNHVWVHRPDSPFGLPPDALTMAELFQENGYATACIGKWHLGFDEQFLPQSQGFDYHFGILHNLDIYETLHFEDKGGIPVMRNQEVVERPADPNGLTQDYTDETIRWMTEHVEQSSDPFFLYLPHTMLHEPLGVSEAFKGSSNWGDYGDAIQELDHHFGRLMGTLQDLEIADNTVVIYLSDNGKGPGRNPDQPIRGSKLTTLEGGLRVPGIVWGPGLGIQEGVTSREMTHAMDWFPTLASLADIRVPDHVILDGRDMSSYLLGQENSVTAFPEVPSLNSNISYRRYWNPGREWIETQPISRAEYLNAFFYHGSTGELGAVRSGKWKLHLNPSPVLYDLEKDPGERQPVSDWKTIWKMRGFAAMFQEEMALFAQSPGIATPLSLSTGKGDLEEHLDLTYFEEGDVALQLDLYRPKYATGPLPTVVCIHGGGWENGTRQGFSKIAKALAKQGFCTATISYRLSGEAQFPAQIEDSKAAVRWLRQNADRYGIDASRIGALGHSAGGHLAALLATSGDVTEIEVGSGAGLVSSRIQAAVASGAQTDFLSERNRLISAKPEAGRIWRKFMGGSQDDKPEAYRLASPRAHLDAGDPPVAFMTGELDGSSTHADDFRADAAKLGISTQLMVIEGEGHNYNRDAESFDLSITWAARFLHENLK